MENNLHQIRIKSKKTQSDVADYLGISYQAYAHYEKGRRQPSPEQLALLADYFNVNVDDILGRNTISDEERKSGLSETKKESITPLEDDMLYVFREIGKKYGVETQKAAITMLQKMI